MQVHTQVHMHFHPQEEEEEEEGSRNSGAGGTSEVKVISSYLCGEKAEAQGGKGAQGSKGGAGRGVRFLNSQCSSIFLTHGGRDPGRRRERICGSSSIYHIVCSYHQPTQGSLSLCVQSRKLGSGREIFTPSYRAGPKFTSSGSILLPCAVTNE